MTGNMFPQHYIETAPLTGRRFRRYDTLFPNSFINQLKAATDIERVISSYVSLNQHGGRLRGLCPFHVETEPSFSVFPDNQNYYCFGCGNGGDVIAFICNFERLGYAEAVRLLAKNAGLAPPEVDMDGKAAVHKESVLAVNREAAKFFHGKLASESGRPAMVYLTGRGLNAKTVKRFGLGFAPAGWEELQTHLASKGFSFEDMSAAELVRKGRKGRYHDSFRDRVMFPIIDCRGNVIAFGGRTLYGAGPKYLNSADTPLFKKSHNLFALNLAKAARTDSLILVEGYMDVITMHQAGFNNTVATLGTSLTEEQVRLISQYAKRVFVAYDSDDAGREATKRAIDIFSKYGFPASAIEFAGAKDPDEFIKNYGPDKFQALLDFEARP
jgi:DNA primase